MRAEPSEPRKGHAGTATPSGLLEPRLVEGRTMVIAGLAERHRGTNAEIPAQWQRFAPLIGKVPGQVGRVAYGVIFDARKDIHSFGYLAGVEVADASQIPDGLGHLEIPSQRYAVFAHTGHVSTLAETIAAACRQWLPASGYRHADDGVDLFERYGEQFDPRAGLGEIEVWLPIIG